LAALLHGTLVVGVSQTLRRWTEGATYIRQGGHHIWHWPTFLVAFHQLAPLCIRRKQLMSTYNLFRFCILLILRAHVCCKVSAKMMDFFDPNFDRKYKYWILLTRSRKLRKIVLNSLKSSHWSNFIEINFTTIGYAYTTMAYVLFQTAA